MISSDCPATYVSRPRSTRAILPAVAATGDAVSAVASIIAKVSPMRSSARMTWPSQRRQRMAVRVATGMVYGNCHYGDALGAKIGAVPVIIPFAWFMMIYASWIVAHILAT